MKTHLKILSTAKELLNPTTVPQSMEAAATAATAATAGRMNTVKKKATEPPNWQL
jgi:hypothetical protein